ncbi:hypothetical protein, partial [Maribacter sp.]|uniref:hypothetical protein n=1 Tax=Maribacter sp. TaxID=1897614 RepID=UPI0025BA8DB9
MLKPSFRGLFTYQKQKSYVHPVYIIIIINLPAVWMVKKRIFIMIQNFFILCSGADSELLKTC